MITRGGTGVPDYGNYGVYVVWAFTLIAVLDTFLMTQRLKKAAEAKFGQMQPGLRWYAASRALSRQVCRAQLKASFVSSRRQMLP